MKKLVLVLALVLTFLPSFTTVANAQAYRGTVIDALKFDIDKVNPGDVITRTFTVTHDYQEVNKAIPLYLRSADFTQGDKPGIPQFLEKDQLSENSRLSDWITFQKDHILLTQRGDVEDVTFTIHVPLDAEPGGHYAAIFLANKNGTDALKGLTDSGFGLNGEVGPLIFLTVNGDITRNIQFDKLTTSDIKGKVRRFFFNPPVNIDVTLSNQGNVHLAPFGRVYLYKGKDFTKYLATFELNPKSNLILPATSRTFDFNWDDSFILTEIKKDAKEPSDRTYKTTFNWDKLSRIRLGKYKIAVQYSYSLGDGESANLPMITTSIFLFPWQLILLLLIIIVYILIRKLLKKDQPRKHKKKRKKEVAHKRPVLYYDYQ